MTDSETTPAPTTPASAARRFLPLLLIAAGIALVYAMGWHRHLSFEVVAERRETLTQFVDDSLLVAALLYALGYALLVAFSLPAAAVVTITGGFLFGVVLGAALTVAAATLGATVLFLAARSALGGVLREKAGPFLNALADGFQREAFGYLLFLRLAPVFPFWLVNLAPACLGMRLAPYVAATAIGIVPGTLAFSWIGSGLGGLIDAADHARRRCLAEAPQAACPLEIDVASLASEFVPAFAALAVAALIPVGLKRFRARRRLRDHDDPENPIAERSDS